MPHIKLKRFKHALSDQTDIKPNLQGTLTEPLDLLKIAYQGVIPLPASDIYQHQLQRPAPFPRQIQKEEITLTSIQAVTESHFIYTEEGFYRPGQRRDILKRMRQKDWKIQSELDLHGLTVEQALFAAQHFLQQCVNQGIQRVCIIHGKGLGSSNQESVLKKPIFQWLTHQSFVLALTHPLAAQGGVGALLVLIKKTGKPPE